MYMRLSYIIILASAYGDYMVEAAIVVIPLSGHGALILYSREPKTTHGPGVISDQNRDDCIHIHVHMPLRGAIKVRNPSPGPTHLSPGVLIHVSCIIPPFLFQCKKYSSVLFVIHSH